MTSPKIDVSFVIPVYNEEENLPDFYRELTAALAAGFDRSRGEIIITLDADLQNDPADVPLLVTIVKKRFVIRTCFHFVNTHLASEEPLA
jgi:glycosyltransferase involved in cell wall biosynthesis